MPEKTALKHATALVNLAIDFAIRDSLALAKEQCSAEKVLLQKWQDF